MIKKIIKLYIEAIINVLEKIKKLIEKQKMNKHTKSDVNVSTSDAIHTPQYSQFYKPKIYITTLNEMKFYTVLLEIAKELDYIVFSQVSLYNII